MMWLTLSRMKYRSVRKLRSCARPLCIEKNHQPYFLAFSQKQLCKLESCDTANTMTAQQVWPFGLNGA